MVWTRIDVYTTFTVQNHSQCTSLAQLILRIRRPYLSYHHLDATIDLPSCLCRPTEVSPQVRWNTASPTAPIIDTTTPSSKHEKRGSSGNLHPSNIYFIAQNAVQSPCLQLLGLSTSWDVTLNQLYIEQRGQHMGATRAFSPEDVFEKLHSKACTKLAISHQCVLIPTHI